MGRWWLKLHYLFQDIKYTPLFSGASVFLLLPCCQQENIAGIDSHCIPVSFLTHRSVAVLAIRISGTALIQTTQDLFLVRI